jgi:serine/threonine protein kinase
MSAAFAIKPVEPIPLFDLTLELFEQLVNFINLDKRKTWVLKIQAKPDGSFDYVLKDKPFDADTAKAVSQSPKEKAKKKLLGKGSYGEVFAVKKESRDRYAKKFFLIGASCSPYQLEKKRFLEESGRELLSIIRECIMFSSLHPGFQRYRLAVESSSNHYQTRMTMDFLGKHDFYHYLSPGCKINPRAPKRWFRYFGQICQSLFEFHHKLKAAHLDVKPSNMFVLNSRELKLGDFGAALFESEFLSEGSSEKTTSWYRPIEAFMSSDSENSQNHGYWTDVYSVAASFLQVLGLDLEEICDICEGEDPDWDDISEILDTFLEESFTDQFLKPAKFSDLMIKNLCNLMKAMMAFGSKERFSYRFLGQLAEFFLATADILNKNPEKISAIKFPPELKTEVIRSRDYFKDSDVSGSRESKAKAEDAEKARMRKKIKLTARSDVDASPAGSGLVLTSGPSCSCDEPKLSPALPFFWGSLAGAGASGSQTITSEVLEATKAKEKDAGKDEEVESGDVLAKS